MKRPDAAGTSVAALVGESEGVDVVEGLTIDGLGVLVVELDLTGEAEAPTGSDSMKMKEAPGLEPTEDTDGSEPSEQAKLLSCPMREG